MPNDVTPFGPRATGTDLVMPGQQAPGYVTGGWGGDDGTAAGLDWRRYLAALRRNKWAFLGIVLSGLALGFLATRFIKPEYTAQTTIWIESGSQRTESGQYGPIRQQGLLTSYAWQHLLRSFEVLEPVVLETRLYLKPAVAADSVLFRDFQATDDLLGGEYRLRVDASGRQYTLLDKEDRTIEEGAMGDPIGARLGWQWVPSPGELRAGRTVAFEVRGIRDIARQLATDLQPQLDLGGNFMSIRLSGPNPDELAYVLTALSQRFVEVAVRLKRAKLDTLTTILEEQLQITQSDLEDAEVALESFKVRTILLPSERGSPVSPGLAETRDPALTNFFEMRLQAANLERDQESLRRVLTQAQGGARVPLEALEVIPSAAASSELKNALDAAALKRAEVRSLTLRYTDEHPDVRALNQELEVLETRTIPGLIQGLISELEARSQAMDEAIASAGTELRAIPARAMEEARLQQQADIQRNLYTDLKQRYEAARLAAVSSVPDVSVLDRARPPREPSSDRRPQVMSIALLASVGLGFLGIVVLDRSDKRLRFPEQVTNALGLTILGTVPHLKRRRDGNITDENAEQVIESFRAIRLSLMHSYGGSGPLVAAISSPSPGDGKSFITSNLALAFTELGYSTLLIDADVRRGCLHKLVGVGRRPGLTDLLSGAVTREDAILTTRTPGLSVIPCGTRMARGPELLAKPAFQALIDELRTQFDVILVDCSPVGAAVDPLIVGTVVGRMVFVLRNGATDKELAEAKLNSFDRLPIRMLGAVLNDVSSDGVYKYYSYVPGYGTSDEIGAGPGQLPVALHPGGEAG